MPANEGLYIGLMSGTSLDGVDAVLADFSVTPSRVRGAVHRDFPTPLRAQLMALQSSGDDELHRAAMAANALVDVYAGAVDALLRETSVDRSAVTAIGAHGQTVRHRPADGYTWQINNPSRLAEATHIGVVADFRSRDVAAGGQGAPLVPAFHAALFQHPTTARAVINIGGIANVTWLPAVGIDGGGVRGWDTGPGNGLMDAWVERHLGQPYDRDGRWAASGVVVPALSRALADEPYFTLLPPKSTGRDLFNTTWLDHKLSAFPAIDARDVQATLLELTASSIAASLHKHCAGVAEILICGGGARNGALMRAIADALGQDGSEHPIVHTTEALGVPVDQVEALAFAWLARASILGEAGNLPAVTGAIGPRVLGALYPR